MSPPSQNTDLHDTRAQGTDQGSVDYQQEGSALIFSPSAAKRRRAALKRGVLATALTTFVLGLLFLPDYFASYAGKAPQEQLLFGVSLLLVGALIGFALMISHQATRERWILDASREELVCERRLFGFSPRQEVLDLAQVKGFVVDGQALKAELLDGYLLELVREDFETSHGQRFLDAIVKFCRSHCERLATIRR